MTLQGRDLFFRLDIKIETMRLGSGYGGWEIPTEGLQPNSIVYSAGIGKDISFDAEIISRKKVTVYAFDPTPASLEWLDQQELPKEFIVHPYGLADYDGTATFHIPKNPNHVSHSIIGSQVTQNTTVNVDVMRIPSIMKKLNHEHLDLLKMDIEGAEYSVVNDMLKSGVRPSILLIEFHHRFKSVGAKKTKDCVDSLRQTGYSLYSVSATGEEFGFIYTP